MSGRKCCTCRHAAEVMKLAGQRILDVNKRNVAIHAQHDTE